MMGGSDEKKRGESMGGALVVRGAVWRVALRAWFCEHGLECWNLAVEW